MLFDILYSELQCNWKALHNEHGLYLVATYFHAQLQQVIPCSIVQ